MAYMYVSPVSKTAKNKNVTKTLKNIFLRFAQQEPPIHSTRTETLSGDLNMSIPCIGC